MNEVCTKANKLEEKKCVCICHKNCQKPSHERVCTHKNRTKKKQKKNS